MRVLNNHIGSLFQVAEDALKDVGPRYAGLKPWKGKYLDVEITYWIPLYAWEKDPDRSLGVLGFLNMPPNTWISACKRLDAWLKFHEWFQPFDETSYSRSYQLARIESQNKEWKLNKHEFGKINLEEAETSNKSDNI